jgi:hypothetical protein
MASLPGGDLLLAGGWTASYVTTAASYLYTAGEWKPKASMNTPRVNSACATHMDQVWVGGAYPNDDTVEIYSLAQDVWLPGPDLPYKANYPGEFVSHGHALFYVGGSGRRDIWQLNTAGDGWTFVSI